MIGKTFSHYRIIGHLGHGGMGDVYLAEDLLLSRKVALKFMAQDLARDPDALARFLNEAKAAGELSHPNIACIHDVGEDDGQQFLVLEHVEGETLRARIDRSPLSVSEVIQVGKCLAEGLAHAHSHGIVHRDVKSANVMLTGEGSVKILDFGLARRGEATLKTPVGAVLGTVAYLSPERIQGKKADFRSDLWALGVILYECLTGTRPFRGEDNYALMHGILTRVPDRPSSLRTRIPLELEKTVLRCLEKDPAFRYQHAEDLLAELRRIESHISSTGRTWEATPAGSRDATERVRGRARISPAAHRFPCPGGSRVFCLLYLHPAPGASPSRSTPPDHGPPIRQCRPN